MAWLKVTGVLAAAVAGTLALASPAFADTGLTLNPDHKDTTAAEFAAENDEDCSAPFTDSMTEDGWHFTWPAGGDLSSLTATFNAGSGNFNVVITGTVGSPSTDGSTWHGYLDDTGAGDFKFVDLWTQPGWTLVDATAAGTGADLEKNNATRFNLSHVCLGTSTTPSPSASPTPTTPWTTGTVTDPGATDPGGALPTTGVALTGIVGTGFALIAGGAGLVFLRRRRDKVTS